jgi:hypothetical protein
MVSLEMYSKPTSLSTSSMSSLSKTSESLQIPPQVMLNVGQGLDLQQQSLKPHGHVCMFLQGYQVLNLTEGHHNLDPLLLASVLEYRKLSEVLGTSVWIVWIHEVLQIDPLRLVRVRPIHLFHLLHLGNKRNRGDSFGQKEEKQRKIRKN